MKRVLLVLVAVLCVLSWSRESVAQTPILSLRECIDIAEERSTMVGSSRERLARSRQQVLNSYGNFLPNAVFSANAGRNFVGPTGSVLLDAQGRPIQPTGFDHEQYSFSLTSNVLLFDWGSSVNTLRGSKRNATASEYDLQYQKDTVTALVIRDYYNFVRQKNLLVVQEEAVEAAAKNLEQVEAFFRIGSNTKADVLQARVRLGNTQLELITAKNNVEIAKAQLASTLNMGLEEDFDVDPSIDVKMVDLSLEEEVQYMLGHRSDLIAGRYRIAAAANNLTATENARWPTLSASLGYFWNDRIFPGNGNVFRNNYVWTLGVALNWNIFDRFQTKSGILDAKALERIAQYNLQQAKLDAILEVKTLYLRLAESGERMRVSEVQVAQAEENFRLARERYRVGAGTILETIEAQAQQQRAQSSLVEARIDYMIARAELQRAVGRAVTAE